MHFHPRAMPNRAFTRQAFFRVWRRFKQEDVHRLLHSPSFATKPKTGSSERRYELETRETRLFADLPHGRFASVSPSSWWPFGNVHRPYGSLIKKTSTAPFFLR